MECDNCGLVSNSMGTRFGYCPFCDAKYLPITSVVVNRVPSPDTARELRDLYTGLANMLTKSQLGEIDEKFKPIEKRLYTHCNEQAEYYDDIAGGL